jgi:hypothetical protein
MLEQVLAVFVPRFKFQFKGAFFPALSTKAAGLILLLIRSGFRHVVALTLQTRQTISLWKSEPTTSITGFGKCEVVLSAFHFQRTCLHADQLGYEKLHHFCLPKGPHLNRFECMGVEAMGDVMQKAYNCPQTQGGWQVKKFIISLFPVSQINEIAVPLQEE